MKRSLTDIEHLKRRDDISRLFKYGEKVQKGIISVRCIKNKSFNTNVKYNRYVFVPQRNFGSSVKRNLIRRRLREICRTGQNAIYNGFDIAVFVKKESVFLSYSDLRHIVFDLFAKLNLISIDKFEIV